MGNFSNIPDVRELIKTHGTKIFIYFAIRGTSDDFDPYTKNYTYTELPPKAIIGYLVQISPEKLVWKEYGLQEIGAVEILCDDRYKDWFKHCHRIVINGEDYSVFKIGNGSRVLVQDRPGGLIRVILEKKG